MLGFETRLETREPPEAVFDRIADLDQWSTFRGWGPMPGITRAELVEGTAVAAGALVRVTNSDGSVHHERFEVFDRGRALRIRMELGPPAGWFLAGIVETLAPGPDGVLVRRFELTPRSWLTLPMVWLIRGMLRRAVLAHNAAW